MQWKSNAKKKPKARNLQRPSQFLVELLPSETECRRSGVHITRTRVSAYQGNIPSQTRVGGEDHEVFKWTRSSTSGSNPHIRSTSFGVGERGQTDNHENPGRHQVCPMSYVQPKTVGNSWEITGRRHPGHILGLWSPPSRHSCNT